MKNLSPRRLLIIGLLLLLPMTISLALSPKSADEDPWPLAARETAQEISLSDAWKLLNDPVDGRRAAVLGMELLIETPATAEDLAEAANEKDAPSTGEESPAAAGKSKAEAEPTGLNEAGTHMHQVAQLPYPASGLISSMATDAAVDVRIYEPLSLTPSWTDRILSIFPTILLLGLLIFFLGRGATKSLGLNSAFEVIKDEDLKETFDDVAGMDAARGEIEEIVNFLKDPKEASRLGGRMPKGALFDGPPGAGKTLLARAMAKEAGVPFITIEASGVNQLFVGAGAMKIKKAFREARKLAPCIVFIDEIDAMGKRRGSSNSGAGDEKETTLNSLLVELDGFDSREGVFLIAATNRPEVLDPALTRRGRIDRKITVDLPDLKARKEILQVHCRKIKAEVGLDIDTIASTTFGFSGADLAALTNEAALLGTRDTPRRDYVALRDFQKARDRLIVGLSGRQRELNAADRHLTAVHEAGHALVAALNPNADPIEKATILPQGRAAGYVMQAPDADRTFETHDRLIARIEVAVAGREAERLILGAGAITSGAESDIQQATRVAEAMVTRYGMSQQGFVALEAQNGTLLDPDNPPLREIVRIISECQARVATLLEEKQDRLIAIADALKEHETLNGEAVCAIARG